MFSYLMSREHDTYLYQSLCRPICDCAALQIILIDCLRIVGHSIRFVDFKIIKQSNGKQRS